MELAFPRMEITGVFSEVHGIGTANYANASKD